LRISSKSRLTCPLNETWGCTLAKRDDPLSRVRRRFKSWLRGRFEPWRVALYGGIRVHYKDWLDGGGSSFGQEMIRFLRNCGMPRQARVFEWCAGPAFIGFSMLGHGLCETLCLADINPMAVTACRRTIARNGLDGNVRVYHSDNLSAIPSEEQWDLVVGNPPFFDIGAFHLRAHDKGWRLHREFFATIGRFLRPGGIIVLQENNLGSTAETFREMIETAGLAIVFVYGCAPQRTPNSRIYYIGIMRRGDVVPAWASNAGIEPTPTRTRGMRD
jgi:16S rRNA G966 N2-methylase RsmD